MKSPNAGEDVGKLVRSFTASGNVKCHTQSEKYFGGFLKTKKQTIKTPKLSMQQWYDPVIVLLNIYLKEMET